MINFWFGPEAQPLLKISIHWSVIVIAAIVLLVRYVIKKNKAAYEKRKPVENKILQTSN